MEQCLSLPWAACTPLASWHSGRCVPGMCVNVNVCEPVRVSEGFEVCVCVCPSRAGGDCHQGGIQER